MDRPVVVVTEALDEECARWLGERAEVRWLPHERPDGLRAGLAEASGLVVRTYTRVGRELLAAAPGLRVVGRGGVGLENIDVAACRERGVEVVHTPSANTQAVVEYVFAVLLEWLRPRRWLQHAIEAPEWERLRAEVVGERQLGDLTLGILGLGRIGSRVARAAAALRMTVLGYDLLGEEAVSAGVDAPLRFTPPDRMLSECDILTLHVDGRPSNRHLLDALALERLRPSCLVVNTARGMLVDSRALARWAARARKHGGGAILDVHEPEPFGIDYPLLGQSNVWLAPHLAARTATALRNMSWVVRDVMEVLEGRPPLYPAPPVECAT